MAQPAYPAGYGAQPQYAYPAQPQYGYPQQPQQQPGYAYPQQQPYAGYPQAGPSYQAGAPMAAPMAAPPQPSVVVVDDPGASAVGEGGSKYLDQCDKLVRLGFIRKVYGILCLQLFITFGIVCAFTFSDTLRTKVAQNPGVMIAALILSFAFLIALACCPNVARKHPTNLICLFGFTLCEALLVGSVASYYNTDAVVKAIVATMVVTLALTALAWQTKYDFTAWLGGMTAVLLCFILAGIWIAIFPSQLASTIYAAIGASIFSLFILIDTQMIIGGKHHTHRFGVDDYVFAALNLYMDIVQLFLYLLRLFGDER